MKYLIIILTILFSCSSSKNLSYDEAIDRNNDEIASQEQQQDAIFLVDAKSNSIFLEQVAQLAVEKGYANVISKYANEIALDHAQLNQQIQQIAEGNKVALPVTMSRTNQQKLDRLQNATQRDFDRIFLQTAERSYEDNIQMFKTVATSAYNDDIRAFAAKKLSMLRKNEERADELEEEII